MSATDTNIAASLRRPIEGPSAWVGADMRGREAEWSYRLSPAEIAEIEAALKSVQARGLDIADIRREDFPLPTLGPVLDRLRGEVLDGRGFVLLRGVPVEDRPIAESAAAYWGIGTLFRQRPLAERARATCSAMSTISAAERDRSEYPQLCDLGAAELPYRSLRCRGAAVPAARQVGRAVGDRQLDDRAQRHGGAPARSAGAAVSAVPRRSARRGAGRQGAVLRGAGVQRARRQSLGAVFTAAYRFVAAVPRGAAAHARGHRGARHAGRAGGRPRIAARHELSCRATSSSCTTTRSCMPAPAYEDWPEVERKRHLLRLWLSPPGARPLPPVFAECYGDITIGDRGGIICKGDAAARAAGAGLKPACRHRRRNWSPSPQACAVAEA